MSTTSTKRAARPSAAARARKSALTPAPVRSIVPLRDFSRSLPMLLLRSRQAVMNRFRPMLRQHGVTEEQWRVLRALTTADALRIGQLAELTYLSMPSLSRLLRALDARALIERRAELGDARATRISISPDGLALIERIAPLSEARYAQIAARIGRSHLEAHYALLGRLTVALADDAQATDPRAHDETDDDNEASESTQVDAPSARRRMARRASG